jgi:hypothetical protein
VNDNNGGAVSTFQRPKLYRLLAYQSPRPIFLSSYLPPLTSCTGHQPAESLHGRFGTIAIRKARVRVGEASSSHGFVSLSCKPITVWGGRGGIEDRCCIEMTELQCDHLLQNNVSAPTYWNVSPDLRHHTVKGVTLDVVPEN